MEQSKPEYPSGQIHWKELPFKAWHVPPFWHGWLAQGSIPNWEIIVIAFEENDQSYDLHNVVLYMDLDSCK